MDDPVYACYRCQNPTTPGMPLERDHGVPSQVRWAAGVPREGVGAMFIGEGSGTRERYRVVTYRCARCGALESFARDPE